MLEPRLAVVIFVFSCVSCCGRGRGGRGEPDVLGGGELGQKWGTARVFMEVSLMHLMRHQNHLLFERLMNNVWVCLARQGFGGKDEEAACVSGTCKWTRRWAKPSVGCLRSVSLGL